MKKAYILVIDIGTNSTRYGLYRKKDMRLIESAAAITRLGKHTAKTGVIAKAGIIKTITCLKKYIKRTARYSPEIKAIGTKVLRTADNASLFLEKAEHLVGAKINIISGKKEALLGFCGAKKSLGAKKMFFIDIGGGSTEIGSSPSNLRSIDVGCVGLREKFLNSSPCKDTAVGNAVRFIKSKIKKPAVLKVPGKCAAIGGTCTTLAAIDIGKKIYDREKVQGYTLSKDRITHIFRKLSSLTVKEIKKIKGVEPERADIICSGVLILLCAMDIFAIDKITVSDEGILLGAALCL
ncbi:MAG: hypothetical protein PHO00_01595 [bacterium]|nr:hypothetical protein [bacterium]